MVNLSNLVIFMPLFCCTIVAENEEGPNTPIKKNKSNSIDSCTVEEQNNSCEKCNNVQSCHFVVWESENRNSTHTLCVGIKRSKVDVQALGPLGNDEKDSHWSMTYIGNLAECNTTSNSSSEGTTDNQGTQNSESVTTTTNPNHSPMPGHSDTSHLAKDATVTEKIKPKPRKVPKAPKSRKRGHSDTAHLGKATTVTTAVNPKSPRTPGHSDTAHLTDLKKSTTANTAAAPSSGFDAGSFVGGMVLVAAIGVLCFAAMKYYNRGNRGFNYLLSSNNRSDIIA